MQNDVASKWLLRVVGFIVGAGIIVALEIAVVYAFSQNHYRLTPRGIGWIAVPIVAGIGGARFAEYSALPFAAHIADPSTGSPAWRRLCLGAICWATGVFLWAFVFDGLGRYWGDDEWAFFWKVLAIPPVFVAAAYWLFSKFGPRNNS